jgi:Fe-S cluster biogenesis protein NfuA
MNRSACRNQRRSSHAKKPCGEFFHGGAMIEAIETALRPIRSSLQADGFDLKVEGVDNGVVSVVVFAGPEACLECLIPEEHFKLRIEDKLKGLVRAVHLRYPETSQASH